MKGRPAMFGSETPRMRPQHSRPLHPAAHRFVGVLVAVALALALPAAATASASATASALASGTPAPPPVVSIASPAFSDIATTAAKLGTRGIAAATPGSPTADRGATYAGGGTLQQYLDSMWEMVSWIHADAARPSVAVERAIAPSEVAAVTVTCLRDEGFASAELVPAGVAAPGDGAAPGVSAAPSVDPGPEAEADPLRYHLALYVCAARYPVAD
jgi:hypothetical protein